MARSARSTGDGLVVYPSHVAAARGVHVYREHPNLTTHEDDRVGFVAHRSNERVSARWYGEGVHWLNALVLELER